MYNAVHSFPQFCRMPTSHHRYITPVKRETPKKILVDPGTSPGVRFFYLFPFFIFIFLFFIFVILLLFCLLQYFQVPFPILHADAFIYLFLLFIVIQPHTILLGKILSFVLSKYVLASFSHSRFY